LLIDDSLLPNPAERLIGRRIERVLYPETAALIQEVLKTTAESGLVLHTEFEQESESGIIRLRAQFTRVHMDRLSVNLTRHGAPLMPAPELGKVEVPDFAAYSEIFKDREFLSLAAEICDVCGKQFGTRQCWLGFPAGGPNVIWLNGQAEAHPPADFDRARIRQVLQGRRDHVVQQARRGGGRSSGLFPLVSEGRVIGLLGVISGKEVSFSSERVEEVRRFAVLISASLKYLLSLLVTQPRLAQVQALREIDQAILSSLNLRETANVILETALQQLPVDAADILILNPHTQTLDFFMGLGFRSRALQHTHLRLGEGYAGVAARVKRMVHIRDLKKNSPEFADTLQYEGESFHTYVGVPLLARGEVIGVLEVFKRSRAVMEPPRLKLLEMIAAQIAIAIDNSALLESVDRSNQHLTTAYNSTIEGLSRALELRDRETEGHAHRVADLSTILAARMGISGVELERARQGALLHDIGKIGIPDKILRKPGKLTAQEWSIMKQHPLYAYTVLSQIEYLKPALAIPLHHHERWDGTGYPHGLSGDEIPLEARVFAVIDVFDALTSDRPYRPAWSKEQAVDYIKGQAGKHFDPRVVDVFNAMIGEVQPPSLAGD
jgi:HD-GYP domain-containing protein (c-di-GMP phosphodiesterase class II)